MRRILEIHRATEIKVAVCVLNKFQIKIHKKFNKMVKFNNSTNYNLNNNNNNNYLIKVSPTVKDW